MLSLRQPSAETLRAFLASQAPLRFTYPAVGATATVPPAGYEVGHIRLKLGEGEEAFERARAAVGRWDQFRLGWVEAWSPDAPIQAGVVVAVFARMFGLWLLNACRVVYVVDEPGPLRRFGFAYGTLPDHVETGEERFLVEWDRASGEVWYDILAFSRPHGVLTRLGQSFARRAQERFRKESAAAMLSAVGSETA